MCPDDTRALLVSCPGVTRALLVLCPHDVAIDCASTNACLRGIFAVETETMLIQRLTLQLAHMTQVLCSTIIANHTNNRLGSMAYCKLELPGDHESGALADHYITSNG